MHGKIALTFSSLFLFLFLFQPVSAQANCDGSKIFSEKTCAGDEINQQEKELFRIVNEYRAQNNLPAVPLSNSLSVVANRHLLDLTKNVKSLTHGWSNCPYDVKNQSTWNCVLDSPKRLNVGYAGNGFENLYRNEKGNATPVLALEAWKKSELHNSLLLNLSVFKNLNFDAFGLAFNGEYVAVWFGAPKLDKLKLTGLGVSFEKAVTGLTDVVSIKKASSNSVNDEWIGTSADKSLILSVSGIKEDISRATISIKIKLEKSAPLNQKNRNIIKIFLTNLASEWKERDAWANASVTKLLQSPKSIQTVDKGNKTFVMSVDGSNFLSIIVKPFRGNAALEL